MGRLLLVDGSNAMIRSHFAHPELESFSGELTGATFGIVNRIKEAVERFEASRVIVCWDGGRSAWRRQLFPGYKDRQPASAALRFEECFAQQGRIAELLDMMGVDQLRVRGVEADDLIAFLTLTAVDDTVIMSTDRDFYQLVNPHVSTYTGAGKDARNVTALTFADTGWSTPIFCHTFRIVNGDAADAIPRVAGLSGEKRFIKVDAALRALGYSGDPVDFFLMRDAPAISDDYDGDETILERIVESWALLGRNTALMDLRFAVEMLPPIAKDDVTVGTWDPRAFERACSMLNFQSVIRAWTEWCATLDVLAERNTR